MLLPAEISTLHPATTLPGAATGLAEPPAPPICRTAWRYGRRRISSRAMNERDYEELAATCDLLLRSADTSLGRIALPLLHVISEHPGLLAPYEPLLAARAPRQEQAPAPAHTSASTILQRAARALGRTVRNRPRTSSALQAPGNVDVLVVSRLNRPAQLDEADDFYFGALQRLLQERGATSVFALVNHLPPNATPRVPGCDNSSARRTVLPNSLTVAAEIRLWAQSAAAGRCAALLSTARYARHPLYGALAQLAGRQALSGIAMRNLRLHRCIATLCRRLSPRIVITTYEGDASERIIWHAAREAQTHPLCVGYQHTSLRARAHAIRRRVNAPGLRCDPDVVLTLGEITEATLAASEALRPVRLITYGSHRRPLSFDGALDAEREPLCLVLPDGDPAESEILFRFAIECARQMPAMTFLLRPHPMSKFDAAALRAIGGIEVPVNILLSTQGQLAQHCARARYCLYRGSSAALQAVLAGVKPFYVARQNELSFDPLFQLNDWREIVADPAEFALRAGAAYSPDCEAARQARRFCERYVSPVRTSALDTLLELTPE